MPGLYGLKSKIPGSFSSTLQKTYGGDADKARSSIYSSYKTAKNPADRMKYRSQLNYFQKQPGQNTAVPAPVAPTPSTPPVDNSAQMGQMMQALLPSMGDLFGLQRTRATDDVAKWAASRGLAASGAEAQARTDRLASVDALEQQTALNLANSNSDRLFNVLKQASDVATNNSNEAFDRQMQAAQLIAQYYNPLEYSMRASEALAGMEGDQAKANSQFIKEQVQRMIAGGGGGGGGGAAPMYVPPPSGPNMLQPDLFRLLGDSATNNGVVNSIFSGLGSYLAGRK